jgi:predicted DNA-binding transcriptional regulator AlpA
MQEQDTYVDEAGAAHRLGMCVRSLQKLRAAGGGPAYTRIGMRRIGYSLAELDRWQASRTFRSRAHELVLKRA